MRGDHVVSLAVERVPVGSPPLARGPRDPRRGEDRHPGITPACAGTTTLTKGSGVMLKDHPRLRGDHWTYLGILTGLIGSPPLARGPPVVAIGAVMIVGITPACAGTTRYRRSWNGGRRDHPRLRGDHSPRRSSSARLSGSPPLARGPQSDTEEYGSENRITPACAGTTPSIVAPYAVPEDHPRLRGDHDTTTGTPAERWGSPPLARGPPRPPTGGRMLRRITPACAGTTTGAPAHGCPSPDHPRLRGDHEEKEAFGGYHEGSPPLARGPLRALFDTYDYHGITPACAGTTLNVPL